jgi:hypothetical protein
MNGILLSVEYKQSKLYERDKNLYIKLYGKAPADVQQKLKSMWEQAGLGPFPEKKAE